MKNAALFFLVLFTVVSCVGCFAGKVGLELPASALLGTILAWLSWKSERDQKSENSDPT